MASICCSAAVSSSPATIANFVHPYAFSRATTDLLTLWAGGKVLANVAPSPPVSGPWAPAHFWRKKLFSNFIYSRLERI